MINNTEVLGVIPARGGSKGIPNKNICDLAGRPLIAWTIEAALESNYLDKVIVSSEDPTIMRVAREFGADVPFTRPTELADDRTPAIEAVLHAADFFPNSGIVVKLQPTSPLRTSQDIDGALEALTANQAESVMSVCTVKHHPNWLKAIDRSGFLSPYEDAPLISNRQQLPPIYALNGAVFAGFREPLFANKGFHCNRTFGYLMPAERSFDVDHPMDLFICKAILSRGAASRE